MGFDPLSWFPSITFSHFATNTNKCLFLLQFSYLTVLRVIQRVCCSKNSLQTVMFMVSLDKISCFNWIDLFFNEGPSMFKRENAWCYNFLSLNYVFQKSAVFICKWYGRFLNFYKFVHYFPKITNDFIFIFQVMLSTFLHCSQTVSLAVTPIQPAVVMPTLGKVCC